MADVTAVGCRPESSLEFRGGENAGYFGRGGHRGDSRLRFRMEPDPKWYAVAHEERMRLSMPSEYRPGRICHGR